MATLLTAIKNIFNDPEYTQRIPSGVQAEITAMGYGKDSLTSVASNAIYEALVNKWAKQDIYSFEFNDVDLTRYDKGYLAYGDIIEDDYIDIASARQFPTLSQGGTVDPYVINKATVKPSYYIGTFSLQYWVTTRTMEVKKAFLSENALNNFVSRSRSVLPESLKLDRYLIFRNMLATMPTAKKFTTNVDTPADSNNFLSMLTPEQVQDIIVKISMAVEAASKSNNQWNKLGVMNSCPKKSMNLIINAGLYRLMKAVLYNSYHDTIDFGLDESQIIPISGFGSVAATNGLYAVLVDERAFKAYTTEMPNMENIYNPAGKYWNTWLTYQGKMAYSLHAISAAFYLDETGEAGG